MSDAVEKPSSKYTLLERPNFEPAIPEHLMAKLTPSEKYLVQSISKLEQEQAWNIQQSLSNNRAIVDLDVRQSVVEAWKNRLTSRWSLGIGFFLLVIPVVLKAVFDWLIKAKVKP